MQQMKMWTCSKLHGFLTLMVLLWVPWFAFSCAFAAKSKSRKDSPTPCFGFYSNSTCLANAGCFFIPDVQLCISKAGIQSCTTLKYGCVPYLQRCSYNKGTRSQRIRSCMLRPDECKWIMNKCSALPTDSPSAFPSSAPFTPGPTSAPSRNEMCLNTCKYARDHSCDDGGPGSLFSACPIGTDCADCGPRTWQQVINALG